MFRFFVKRVGLNFRTLEYSNVEVEVNELEVASETEYESTNITNEDINISNPRVCKICLGVDANTYSTLSSHSDILLLHR